MQKNVKTSPKYSVRKGDIVMAVAGKDRGKTGKVLSVHTEAGTVVVEKLNIIKRHTKPSQKNRQGGILEREAPFSISNVMVYCQNCQRPIRVGRKIIESGRRVRICKKCHEALDRG